MSMNNQRGQGFYETVAASQTAQVLGANGSRLDFLESILVVPASTTAGAVTILDGSTSIIVYTGGTVGADLTPILIPLGLCSKTGPWSITTGAGVSVIAVGKFS